MVPGQKYSTGPASRTGSDGSYAAIDTPLYAGPVAQEGTYAVLDLPTDIGRGTVLVRPTDHRQTIYSVPIDAETAEV